MMMVGGGGELQHRWQSMLVETQTKHHKGTALPTITSPAKHPTPTKTVNLGNKTQLPPHSLGAVCACVSPACADGDVDFLDVLCVVVHSLGHLLLNILLDGVSHLRKGGRGLKGIR